MSREPEDEGREPYAQPFKVLTEAQLITHVGQRLLGERGIEALLQASGVSRFAWTRIEAGEARLTSGHREKLARGLELTVEQLDEEIFHERALYLRWLESHQSRRPESALLTATIEELRCSTLKAGIDRVAFGIKQMVDSYYRVILRGLREGVQAEGRTAAPSEPSSEGGPR